MTSLPPVLAHAIVHEGGGRVVLVVGAGGSIEPPTGLPAGGACAREASRRLVADGVLEEDALESVDDLSAVADVVFHSTGSQQELVDRMPRERFVGAQPNDGHLIAAALLRERAILSVLTLNFDLAFTTALVRVGAATDVAQIRGPEDQARLSAHSLVYLHRTANHPADEWILRSEALEAVWTDSWEHAIASRVLAAPIVVFAGLGSPAAVLTDTARRLRAALAEGVRVLQVDVVPRSESSFADLLDLAQDDYLEDSWVSFMRLLGERVAAEQLDVVAAACTRMTVDNAWPADDVAELCRYLAGRGLLDIGALRARWTLEDTPYLPAHACDADHIADVLLVVRLIERATGSSALPQPDGLVEFWDADRLRGVLAFVSARGKWGWSALEPRVERARSGWRNARTDVRKVVATGVVGARRADIVAPASIVASLPPDDIVRGGPNIDYVDAYELRSDDVSRVGALLDV